MPKISVIIPVYNVEKYLRECLDSVINQTLKDIEIICVDDGSTDDSLKILREYEQKDSRITLLQQENQYAGVARNNGLSLACGEYLLFLDSDDVFELNMFERLYNSSIQSNSDITLCHCRNYIEDTKEYEVNNLIIKEYLTSNNFSSKDMSKYIFQFCNGWAWDKLFKADLIKNNQLKFQALRQSNDTYFVYMALCLANKISVIDDVLINHRMHSSSLEATRTKSPECFYKALVAVKKELEDRNLYQTYEQSFINYCLEFSYWQISTINNKDSKKQMTDLFISLCNELNIKKYSKKYFYNQKFYRKCMNLYKYRTFNSLLEQIFSIKNSENYKVITILGIKIKTKRKNNYIYIVDENNDYIKVKRLKGLKIKFNGSNNTVIIHKTVKFNKCKMLLNSNDKIEIASNNGFGIENVLFWISSNNCTVQIGENTSMHGGTLHLRNKPNTKIIIGNNCLFSSNVIIRTSDGYSIYDIDTKELLNQDEDVIINDNVWICNGVKILKGAQIPSNCVIATGAIITKKLKRENCIYANVNHIVKENIMWSNISPHEYRKGNIK